MGIMLLVELYKCNISLAVENREILIIVDIYLKSC